MYLSEACYGSTPSTMEASVAGDHDMEREEDRINWVLCRSSHMGGMKKKSRGTEVSKDNVEK